MRHVKSTSNDVGLSYGGRFLGIVNINGQESLQYGESTRAEISCPMNFWNYPFDTQFCNFILEPLNWDFQLVNSPYLQSSQLDDQNTMMSYDIEIVPLPQELHVRHPDPVGFLLKILNLTYFWSQNVLKILEATFPHRKDFKVNTVGFTYKLTRKYSKFIFIYYIPRYSFQLHSKEESSSDIFSYSCLCVVSSWGSFLISPKVLSSKRPKT